MSKYREFILCGQYRCEISENLVIFTVMPRNKLKKYRDIDAFPNVVYRPNSIAGRWGTEFFHNDGPIALELGCGAGKTTLELARRHPGRNYIGIDNKRARVWWGARNALEEELNNVAFITARIETIGDYFGCDEIKEVWITFPDPYPKPSKSNKRLISPEFIQIYRKFSAPECIFHFKTDDNALFEFTLKTLEKENALIHRISRNTHEDPDLDEDVKIQTVYEARHLEDGKTIKYVCFSLATDYTD